ncbi:transketolase [Candidatus Uhrbacteria bacterium CG10_big_fil_rev_8_21_14_0_10_50_16]|uniref:Transketolase n=1 Tax=Candidatus Uhrbacteria bacterium CG10_big_fil_rev_8_21_14_0_10_50_16 TaxID=1975039 RepID=A0A2H0RP09_9BACT|nr:MAG: transketolase [Candidatus Uhrbacteria bacterium CG10_big_fil_rev_8_21_14_0_10_50_16]
MLTIHDEEVRAIEDRAQEMRRDLIKMLTHAGSGHSAGPLDLAEIFATLYFHVMSYKRTMPNWKHRDRLYLSCGHVVPIQYVAMAHAGFFPKKELMSLRRYGTRLQGHPEYGVLPGIENTSGPLGNGSSQSCGAAYALRMNKSRSHVYCILSDGELEEGITWESAMFAGKEKLHNMTWIIDRNNIQIDGPTEVVMPLEGLRAKFEAFNFHVMEIDGHNVREIVDAIGQGHAVTEKPTVIIAHTIPGKGVDFMEYDYHWHGKPPNPQEARAALAQLRTLDGKIDSECN